MASQIESKDSLDAQTPENCRPPPIAHQSEPAETWPDGNSKLLANSPISEEDEKPRVHDDDGACAGLADNGEVDLDDDLSLDNEVRERGEYKYTADKENDGWDAARAWLWSLPRRRNVLFEEVEEWVKSNKEKLCREIVTMPRSHLFRFLVAQHKLMRRVEQIEDLEFLEPPTARFRRSDKWKPVYLWLESLDSGSVVGAKAIDAWLEENPNLKEELLGKHTRHHLFHYIQKCHTNMIKKKKKQILNGTMLRPDERKKKKKRKKKSRKFLKSALETLVPEINSAVNGTTKPSASTSIATSEPMQMQTEKPKGTFSFDIKMLGIATPMDKVEAKKRYEILSELQEQLLIQMTKIKEEMRLATAVEALEKPSTSAVPSGENINQAGSSASALDLQIEDSESRMRRRARESMRSRSQSDMKSTKRRRKGKEKFHSAVLSWAFTEIVTGNSNLKNWESKSSLEKVSFRDESSSVASQNGPYGLSTSKAVFNLLKCIQERETGAGTGCTVAPFYSLRTRRRHRWKSFIEGWHSLERQYTGCGVFLERKAFSTWQPCWSAYTSSVAVAAPLGMVDQGVQKVLDVRFHPKNVAQLVCSSNAAPNELLLYDLLTGKATELVGHNCQIQAVEFAVDGERIVSCGSNLVKIWDPVTGACLHTMGPGPWDENASGHKKKINAMAVNEWQSCVVATSGGHGDCRVLLWDINSGELSCDLNRDLRNKTAELPCMDALEFCNQNLLICGSDSSGGPAIVQVWDVQAPEMIASFPANDSYITSLVTDPNATTIASGGGDGSVGLFDMRTCGGIARLPLGSNCEVTAVSFSSCGLFLQASSTANKTIVWDTRMIPMEPGPKPVDTPLPFADYVSRKFRALHCLSHGVPMPTSANAGQLPGFVDEGDQGVNDARWFHNDSILVTASGNGSIAMWDVSLGDPCIRHMTSHTRCINTVAISPNDTFICSGGDDQKVVLYENIRDRSSKNWRLTHPLLDETAMDS